MVRRFCSHNIHTIGIVLLMKWLKIVISLALIVLIYLVLQDDPTKIDNRGLSNTGEKSKQLSKTDRDPFESITIPYLRNREYKSSLGDLKLYSENNTYATYLTSYDSDGLKVNGLLTIPKGDGPHPAIVFVHGYIAPTVYKTTEKYGDYVDYLGKNGFVVFKIDLRGHGDSEGEPGGAYYSGDYVIDTLNAYSALENSEFVDPDKIGLWGHSMAGNVTFRSLVAKSDIPAVVIWAGAGYAYNDLQKYRIMDTSYRPPQMNNVVSQKRQKLRELHGEFNPDNEFWQKIVPTNYLGGVSTAMQINHAVNDDVVSIEYGRNLMKILNDYPMIHELNEYQNGGHNLTGASFGPAMKATVEFYKKHLY